MILETQDIVLSPGLEDHGRHIISLFELWRDLQRSTMDSTQAPIPDLLSFVHSALLFAVILQKKEIPPNENSGSLAAELEIPWERPTVDFDRGPIGMVFLTSSPQPDAPCGEISIGIILDQRSRGQGFGRQVVQLLMGWVFDDMKFHRIQAIVLDNPDKSHAVTLFTQLGFSHEGTRRRAVFCPVDVAWKDATYLAILDTDWFMRSYFTPAPRSLWDELFIRHQREREELLRWEERTTKLKRTASMETVRLDSAPSDAAPSSTFGSRFGSVVDQATETDIPTTITAVECSGDSIMMQGDAYDGFSFDQASTHTPPPPSESELSDAFADDIDIEDRQAQVAIWRDRALAISPAAAAAAVERPPTIRSNSPDGSVDSQWDLLDSVSSGSLSGYEYLLPDDEFP